MKAIVIVFMPARNEEAATEQSLALRSAGTSQLPTNLAHAQDRFPQLPDSNQTTPPFWTWFIENPRHASA